LKERIKKVTTKIRNYLWVRENHPCRSKIAWPTCCLKKSDGGLGLMDPIEAGTTLMCK
jgi:hypothetical protein